jgi:hypothetical protein
MSTVGSTTRVVQRRVVHRRAVHRRAVHRRSHRSFLARVLLPVALLVAFATTSDHATALFGDSSLRGANGFTTSSLAAPTAIAAAAVGANVTVTWTASVSGIASGTEIYRATTSGGPYALIATVTPATTTSYVDTVGTSGTYYYVIRSIYQSWFSPNTAEVSAVVTLSLTTGFLPCTAQLNDTGGDGTGYNNGGLQANACADDGLTAADNKSGNTTSTLCTNTGKDRHRFWNFGLTAVPPTATILGVEVQVKVGTNNNAGITLVCAELSWNGGTTWSPLIRSVAIPNTALTVYTMGGQADTWGRTWAGTDFTNTNFRVRLIDVSDSTNKNFLLDFVKVRVTYAP